MNNSSIKYQIIVLWQIVSMMPEKFRKHFWMLLASNFILALVETGTVGIIAFFAAAVSDPNATIQTDFIRYAGYVFGNTPFSSPKLMIGTLGMLVIFCVVLKNFCSGVITFSISKFSALMEAEFGSRLLNRFLYSSYQWSLKENSADLVHAIGWRLYLGRMFLTPCFNIIGSFFLLVALMGTLILIKPLVFLLFLVFQGGATYILYGRLRRQLDRSVAKCRDYDRTINREATKAIHGLKDVKIAQAEPFFLDCFIQNAKPFAKNFACQQFWKAAPLLTLETIGFLLIVGTIGFMLFVLNFSPLEITGLTAFLAVSAWRTLPALNRVISGFTNIGTSLPYLEVVLGYLVEDPSPQKTLAQNGDDNYHTALRFDCEIHFEHVCFSYDEGARDVFNDLDFSIDKGETVGILGPSGAGKSTLVDLLTGLLRPQKGRILIDGKNLNGGHLSQWLKCIGYVPQFPYIIDGSLAENVAFGIPDEMINRRKVLESCALAAIDFLEDLPDGIDTRIGERGVRLSGGQRQRVTIARALYREPKILILDEATSSLDVKSEKEILETVFKLGRTVTVVLISHKESVVQRCNKIVTIN